MPDELCSEGYGPSLCMPGKTGRRRSGAAISSLGREGRLPNLVTERVEELI
jgi:hypothetical protein